MKLKQYPKYKDSRVEWIREIPEDWEISRIKFEGFLQAGIGKEGSYFGRGSPFISYTNIYNSYELKWTSNLVDSTREEQVRFSVLSGDVFFTRTSETMEDIGNASTCLNTIPNATYTGFAIRFRKWNSKLNNKYMMYFFSNKEIRKYFHKYMNIVTRASLSQGKLKNCCILIPPKKEQTQIATFLDSKTKNIDQAIEKVKQIKDLLKKKRLALIGNIILDSNVQEIRLEHIVDKITRSIHRKNKISYCPLGLYNWGRGIFHKTETKGEELGDSTFYFVKENDLILSGQFAWEGAVAIASSKEDGCVVSHRFPIIKGKKGILLTEYLWAFFTSKKGDFILNECSIGSAGRNRPLNINRLMKEKIPVPELEIQKKIVKIVKKENKLELLNKQFVKLMKEYKKSLIHHVVTGKVDVRGVEV